jgi:hypothetical protein
MRNWEGGRGNGEVGIGKGEVGKRMDGALERATGRGETGKNRMTDSGCRWWRKGVRGRWEALVRMGDGRWKNKERRRW